MRLSYTVICCAIFLPYSGRIPSVTVKYITMFKGATSVSIDKVHHYVYSLQSYYVTVNSSYA